MEKILIISSQPDYRLIVLLNVAFRLRDSCCFQPNGGLEKTWEIGCGHIKSPEGGEKRSYFHPFQERRAV